MFVKLFLYSLFLVALIMGVYLLRKFFFRKENGDVFQGVGQNQKYEEHEKRVVVFKTDLLCEGCVDRLTPHINKLSGIDFWDIDMRHPDKLLRIVGDNFSEEELIELFQKHGYLAQVLRK